MSYVSHAFASAHCCLVVTCWERADLLALVGDVYCVFVTCPCGILGQVFYLIVSITDLCRLYYFCKFSEQMKIIKLNCNYEHFSKIIEKNIFHCKSFVKAE